MPSPAVNLTFDFWPQNLISTFVNANTSAMKLGRNFLHWFFEITMVFTKFSAGRTDARTHSQTDTFKYTSASGTEGFRRHKNRNWWLSPVTHIRYCTCHSAPINILRANEAANGLLQSVASVRVSVCQLNNYWKSIDWCNSVGIRVMVSRRRGWDLVTSDLDLLCWQPFKLNLCFVLFCCLK